VRPPDVTFVPHPLPTAFERFKDDYIDHLFMVSSDGQWLPQMRFCLQGVVAQSNDTICRLIDPG
jgi:hypothetical protein